MGYVLLSISKKYTSLASKLSW